jgi:ElaB/YqjD/DUF883 family membrane-anchored ribosome-binding protein
MDDKDVTREQMNETRASLSEQMETLEQRVTDTVSGAADAVTQTVDNVKDAVHDTVENVKDAFDLRLQVTRHPWVALGGSIALGCLAGYLLTRRDPEQPKANGRSQPAPPESPRSVEKPDAVAKAPRFQVEAFVKKPVRDAAPPTPDAGWMDGIRRHFGAEIDKVQGIAIGAALGVVRDVITHSAPEMFKVGLADVIDGLTVKMGGDPIHGPILKETVSAAADCSAPVPKSSPTCGHRN